VQSVVDHQLIRKIIYDAILFTANGQYSIICTNANDRKTCGTIDKGRKRIDIGQEWLVVATNVDQPLTNRGHPSTTIEVIFAKIYMIEQLVLPCLESMVNI
jgi:hypothetical protein